MILYSGKRYWWVDWGPLGWMGSWGGWDSLSSATVFTISVTKIHREVLTWQLHDPCWINLTFPLLWSACPCWETCILVIKATRQQQREICSGWHRTYHQICLEKWQAPLRLLKTQCTVRKIPAISHATWAAVWINGSNLCVVLPSKLLLNVSQEYCIILVYAAHFPHRPNCRCIK